MVKALRIILRPLASLKLTLALLALALALVFVGTLAQRDMDAYRAQQTFFRAWIVLTGNIQLAPGLVIPLPFPGGLTLGSALLINLIAAHATRFQFTWRKSGILLTHLGIIFLLISEIVTAMLAVESQMVLDIGQTKNYAVELHAYELAVTSPSTEPGLDDVLAIPTWMLADDRTIRHPQLPFTLTVKQWLGDSMLARPDPARGLNPPTAEGLGSMAVPIPMPPPGSPNIPRDMAQVRDVPSAILHLRTPEADLGPRLVSGHVDFGETVTIQGKPFTLSLRNKRHYYPFQITLTDFKHEKYQGTDLPRNFQSTVRLIDPTTGLDSTRLIYMNHPLRYAGKTFYQASLANNDRTSILLVVDNPGWLIPYIASGVIGLGLLIQFSISLLRFGLRMVNPRAAESGSEGTGLNTVGVPGTVPGKLPGGMPGGIPGAGNVPGGGAA